MTPLLASAQAKLRHIYPDQLRKPDHLLAIDYNDAKHTHVDLPGGPTVFHKRHIEARHVTVVALVGRPALELPDDAWLTVYRPGDAA